MGYAYYVLSDGREAGYSVPDACNAPECNADIDRGLAHLCGRTPGGDEWGCGGYFCASHLFVVPQGDVPQLCGPCADRQVSGEP